MKLTKLQRDALRLAAWYSDGAIGGGAPRVSSDARSILLLASDSDGDDGVTFQECTEIRASMFLSEVF